MRIDLKQTQEHLLQGGVAAVPTETVYGLAASLAREEAIEKIFSLKSRPRNNPLIVHIANFEQLETIAEELPPDFKKLTESFWPGALTLVVPAKETVPGSARGGLHTVGIRMPNQPLTLELIKAVGPIVAPSANLSGRPSSTSPEHVEHDFGEEFPVLDGGKCHVGIESTILVFKDGRWAVGRLGSITLEEIESHLSYPLARSDEKRPLCPGQHYKHYSPKAKLILGTGSYTGMPPVVVGFDNRQYPAADRVFSLGDTDQPETVMSNLYNTLRTLDAEGIEAAWVDMDFSRSGLLNTIAERLIRAS